MSHYERIDIDLLRRYNEPGPRYTSYPTAPVFTESYTAADFEREIRETNAADNKTPLSIYTHLPFCDELCYFCGCTMIVTQKPDKKRRYLEYLYREIDRVAEIVSDGRCVEQLHWGGGTPTDHEPEEIAALAAHLRSRFDFASDEEGEFSCEIDPRGLTRAHLEALRNNGFNRISMGVQDFDERVQKAVNRIQPEAMTRQVVEWCRELGFKSVNLDFIYGLPHQTVGSFEN
ncbi:MAG: radical SAM protein, partial [Candidatus Krumholzibacteriota bacterium]|nr:radical SAM protein [Candidatus Krumholzibacteriota bacterium]